MSILDWIIVLIPVGFVMWMGWYSRRYIRGVSDFLSAGRICGRYAICVADVANGLSILTLVAFIEVRYKTGFAMTFWNNILVPLSVVITLTGYCFYRFRETRAMSLGQFLEMRYNRPFRIFAAALRSISEMMANMICPAIAARFFIYYLNLPHTVNIFGFHMPTFILVVIIVLTLAISLICMGGTLALVITDTIQGLFCYPMLVIFTIFVLVKFSWSQEIVPVMLDRVPGESMLNPYDVENLRDFNLFALCTGVLYSIFHQASWIGAGNTTSAKSPHEQKMAAVLGAWRTGFSNIMYIMLAVMIITFLGHCHFAGQAKEVRDSISERISMELITNPTQREEFMKQIHQIKPQEHHINLADKSTAMSQEKNLDTIYFQTALKNLQKIDNSAEKAKANKNFQQFRTLFNQLMMPVTMRHLLPIGLKGMFCLLMILMMISTDDTRIYSAALTISQDVILPFRKADLTPEEHIKMIRWVSIGVGVFFLIGSFCMAQLDYINLFITIMTSLWIGGCGPVMVFGLYSRFGTTAGAFASLISGMTLSLVGILCQRNWASIIYPWLLRHEKVEAVGTLLTRLSDPFNPYIVWTMNPHKFPINSTEIQFMTMIITLLFYVVVSRITYKEPFNLERMLHRGIYNLEGKKEIHEKWTLRNVFRKLIGITPEYSTGDKLIAWGIFFYSFIFRFVIMFVAVVIWNYLKPWSQHAWSNYFLWGDLLIPGVVALISTFWFTIGGYMDLRQLFRDLKTRKVDVLDNGRVEGNVSLSEIKAMEEIKRKQDEK